MIPGDTVACCCCYCGIYYTTVFLNQLSDCGHRIRKEGPFLKQQLVYSGTNTVTVEYEN